MLIKLIEEFDRVFGDRSSVQTIFDVGSRDAKSAVDIKNFFPNSIAYSFECFPPCIEMCKKTIGDRKDIILVEKAVSDVNGFIDFYGTEVDKNVGASSIYVVNP